MSESGGPRRTGREPGTAGRAGRPGAGGAPRGRGASSGARTSAGGSAAAPPDGRGRPIRARDARPELPADVSPDDLDPQVRRELRGLPVGLADRVGGHLAAAGLLIDEDAELAHRHAVAARGLAPRLAAVREAVGLTAYACGRYAEALADLRAVRRMTGAADVLPVIADCERGLGRPERALACLDDPDVRGLSTAERIELLIVASGARRDLGQPEAAVVALQVPELRSAGTEEWTGRLWYAYADALVAAGRAADAHSWFEAVADIDEDDETDARERAAELGGQ